MQERQLALGGLSAGAQLAVYQRVELAAMNSRPGSGVSAVGLAALVLAPYWGERATPELWVGHCFCARCDSSSECLLLLAPGAVQ